MPGWNLNSWVPHALEYVARSKSIFSFQRSKLGFELLIIVVGTVLLGMVFSSILILSLEQQQLEDSARASARRVSTVIQASLEHAMLTNDTAMLDQMMKSVASEVGLHICILDVDGRVRLSSIPDNVDQRFAPGDPRCNACHLTGTDFKSASIPSSKIVGDNMLNVNVISNQPACYSCHGSGTRPLGLLLVETPLADLNAQLSSSFWRLVLSTLITFALLVGLLTPALRRLVIQPVVRLARGAAEIGAGNLDCPVQVDSDDELSELAKTFDAMRQQLKAALLEKESRNRELQILNDIARAASQLLDPQQILDLTIHIAVSSLGVEAGSIHLLDRERTRFTLHACQGIPQCRKMACDIRLFSQAVAGLTRSDGQVVSVPVTIAGGSWGLGQDVEGRSYVGVPLKAKGVLMGAITLITRPGQVVTEEGAKILKAMGEEVGYALANAIQFQNVRYQATLDERERLAREMHDSLAQALGYLKLKASMTDELLSGGEIAQAQANLREVKEIAGKTYFDVREAIFGLRNAALPGSEFLPALEEYLNEYRAYYGLNVKLVVINGYRPSFPAEASIQLTRIIQEALTNVRKHARTSQARVRFERDDLHWRVTVEDDGQGFDSNQVPKAGQPFFGLQIMRERAESIGAKLEIDSQPCGGTRVIIQMPATRED